MCFQINLFLIRKSDRKICLNYKIIQGESLTIQNRVLVMNVRISRREKRSSHMEAPHIKWRNLKDEKQGSFQHKILNGGFGPPQRSVNDMWNKMAKEIGNVISEMLGELRGCEPKAKES